MAFISTCDFRALAEERDAAPGAIYKFEIPELVGPINISGDFQSELNPHGLGLYRYTDGALRLFVVNHTHSGSKIELFDYQDGKLAHRRTVSGQLLFSPNDVAPVGPNQFYATNDHGSVSKWGRIAEDYLRLKRSYVVYYDGRLMRKVAEGLGYANGIAVSADYKRIYVAETTARRVSVYARDLDTGDLTLLERIDMNTGVDNISVAGDGSLWIGAHPKLLTYILHAKKWKRLSPSQVIHLTFKEDGRHDITTLYLNNGSEISGSSVAVPYENMMLVGAVNDGKFLYCRETETEKTEPAQ